MGNCAVISICAPNQRRVLPVTEPDGEVPEFRNSRVGVPEVTSQNLFRESLIKIGKVCYMIPARKHGAEAANQPRSVSAPMAETEQGAGNGKKIRLVITRNQLRKLQSNRVSIEHVLAIRQCRESRGFKASPRIWRPKLETIPE